MIIYNITMKVDWSIAEDWRQWMQQTYISDVINTGCFNNYQFVRLLQVDETDGPTYAIQFYTSALSKYDYYLQHYVSGARQQIKDKWGQKYIEFATLMQIVE